MNEVVEDPNHILQWPADVQRSVFRKLCLTDLVNTSSVCRLFKQRAAHQIAKEAFALLSKHYFIPDYILNHPFILANAHKLPGLVKLLNRLCSQLQPQLNGGLKLEWVLTALMGDEQAVIQQLQEIGIDGDFHPQAVNEGHYYAMGGHWQPFENLLSQFPSPFDVEESDPSQSYAVCAARGGHWQFLLNLEKLGFDLSHLDKKNQFTLLHQAIWFGHLALLENLIAHGVPTNSGKNLILWAAEQGQWEIVDYLTTAKLELSTPENFGEYLTLYAAKSGTLDRFLQYVVQFNLANKLTRLILDRDNVFTAATSGNNFAVIEYLVENGTFDINACTKSKYHILHRAASYGHGELCVKLSQTYKLNNAVEDVNGKTMLHFAVEDENWHCCYLIATQLLKDKIWKTNNLGENILHIAARIGNYWLVRNILENFGIEHMLDQTNDGKTALDFAKQSDNPYLIELFEHFYCLMPNCCNMPSNSSSE